MKHMDMKIQINQPQEAKKYFENKLAFTVGPMEVDYARKEGSSSFNIFDVRAAEDYEEGHIPGAIHLPFENWESFTGMSKDKPNLVYCYSQSCHLAAKAAALFAGKGFPVIEVEGGFEDYKEHELEIEKGFPKEEKKTA
jgi:rhodanese-related sulfurtransferase